MEKRCNDQVTASFDRLDQSVRSDICTGQPADAKVSLHTDAAENSYEAENKKYDKSFCRPINLPGRTKEIEKTRCLELAVDGLFHHKPHYSARVTFTKLQKLFFLCALAVGVYLTVTGSSGFYNGVLLLFTAIFLGCVLLRGLVILCFDDGLSPPKPNEFAAALSSDLPVYTVLVALYREANQVGKLTTSLMALNWPPDRLEIKLICEEIDNDTINAIKHLTLPDHFELIVVPDAAPRTKPKALNYALPSSNGEYLVLYDAEDNPNPNQLLEAHLNFKKLDPSIACLQAPLLIHNYDQSWLTRLFALEYCTLFKGILPVLGNWKVPLPLGGTSNHFKTEILNKVGGWDPYNVTEDADLGLRLGREGYRSHVICLPTWEEAPPDFKNWLPQRTRWLKGWMQTILVHSRNPIDLARDIGWPAFLAFHFLMTSIVLSSLLHPIFLITLLVQLSNPVSLFVSTGDLFLLVCVFIMIGGYTTYGALAYLVLDTNRMGKLKKWIAAIPIYWMLIAVAGWRAAIQLVLNPHYWEKTNHGLAISNLRTTLKEKDDQKGIARRSGLTGAEEPYDNEISRIYDRFRSTSPIPVHSTGNGGRRLPERS